MINITMYIFKRSVLLIYVTLQLVWLSVVPNDAKRDSSPFSFDSLKPLLEGVKYLNPDTNPIKPFMDLIIPRASTTTTTVSPIEDLAQKIMKFPAELPAHLGADLLKNSPLAAGNNILQAIFPAGQTLLDKNPLKGMTQTTGKLVEQLTGVQVDKKVPEEEAMYHEYRNNDEPYGFRSSKYFSRECQFRLACEVGKLLRPFGGAALAATIEKNRFIQDLQSRYTRAVTYGLVYDNCDRYYCLLKQLLGGPIEFAGGMAELVNRIANPDMY